jgi:hypothetical protein
VIIFSALTATDRLLLHRLRSESRLEKMDIASSDNVLRSLLATTVQRYVLAVQYGDAHDLCMYLLIDLWMDNRDDDQLCTLIHVRHGILFSATQPDMGVGVWGIYPPKDLHTSHQNWLRGYGNFFHVVKNFSEKPATFFFCSPEAKFLGVGGYIPPPPSTEKTCPCLDSAVGF